MKRIITVLGLAAALGVTGLGWFGSAVPSASAATPLPACATNGDKDGDGVPDTRDVDEADSCRLTSSGFENCETGAGDGNPDCTD